MFSAQTFWGNTTNKPSFLVEILKEGHMGFIDNPIGKDQTCVSGALLMMI